MKASVLHGPKDVRYEDFPTPEAGEGEVLIDVRATGVCGSDVPRVLSDAAHFYPMVLGHEFSGVVAQLGSGVTGHKVGDRVAVAPLVPCMTCEMCQRGRYSMCPDYTFIGSSRYGALAEYVSVPARNLVPIGEETDFVRAAMIEPSTVALHGLRVGRFRPGEHVAILGGGTVGLFAAQWARILGAKSVTVFDIVAERLALARELGADAAVDSRTEDVEARSAELTGGTGFGHIFETAGQNATQIQAMRLVAKGGRITLIGNSHRDLEFPASAFELLNRRETTLTASWMSYSAPFPGREWTDTVECLANGKLRWSPRLLQGQRTFTLADVGDAFRLYEAPGAVKGKLMFVQGEGGAQNHPGEESDD
jgi:L-iditol 2-dehydrogenase